MPGSLLIPVIDTLTILFLGDVMQHKEQLRDALKDRCDSTLEESYDYSSYFRNIQRLTEAADFTVANMEFSLGGHPFSGYPCFSAPAALPAQAMKDGINLFLCANNHICDRGTAGLERTLNTYEQMGAEITGIYRDSTAEKKENPYIAEIGGIRIAFINFTYGTNGLSVRPPYIVNRMDKEQIRKAIVRGKRGGADLIIALPHWGEEYTLTPSQQQKEWTDFLFSEGVDAIVGTHPHTVQPTAVLRSADRSLKTVAYSLGNFISNMSKENTEIGAAFLLKIGRTIFGQAFIAGCETIPLWCSRRSRFEKGYTVIPVEEYLDHKERFRDGWNHEKMKRTYKRLKYLFER